MGGIDVAQSSPAKAEAVTLQQLLQDEPLHSPRSVSYLFPAPNFGNVAFPAELWLYCESDKCGGTRRYQQDTERQLQFGEIFYCFAAYRCTTCTTTSTVFGIKAERGRGTPLGRCTKIFQEPAFGHPIPKRLFKIIGEDNRENFLQARRAIARGLGIGAYAYYRRIVENTKLQLVGAVLEVAEATHAPPEQIELLKRAASETQFSKALEVLREISAVPAVLLIDGHNPLALLHDLLSEGIHEFSDAECLQRAQEAEVILCEIADRMQIAVSERKNVKAALTSILNRKAGGASATVAS